MPVVGGHEWLHLREKNMMLPSQFSHKSSGTFDFTWRVEPGAVLEENWSSVKVKFYYNTKFFILFFSIVWEVQQLGWKSMDFVAKIWIYYF